MHLNIYFFSELLFSNNFYYIFCKYVVRNIIFNFFNFRHVISGMEARYSHSSHIKKSPEQKLLLVVGGVVLATDPRSDLAIVSMETWTLLGRVALHQRGIPRHFLGHTSHVVATEGNFSEVVVLGGGSNCFSFGTSFTTSPLVVRVDAGMFL